MMQRRSLLGLILGAPVAVAAGAASAATSALGVLGSARSVGSSIGLSVAPGKMVFGDMSSMCISGGSIAADSIQVGRIRAESILPGVVEKSKLALGTDAIAYTGPVTTTAAGLWIRESAEPETIVWGRGMIVQNKAGVRTLHHTEAGRVSTVGIDSLEILWDSQEPRLRVRTSPRDDAPDEDDNTVPVARWSRNTGLVVFLGDDLSEAEAT